MENVRVATCIYSSCASYTKNPGYTAKNTGSQHRIRKRKERTSAYPSALSITLVIFIESLLPSFCSLFPSESKNRHKSSINPVKITVNAASCSQSVISFTSTFSTLSSRAPNRIAAENRKEKTPAIRRLLFSFRFLSLRISLIHTLSDHILRRIVHGNINPPDILADNSQHQQNQPAEKYD